MQWDQYDAVLFDLDGVVTPTAEVHMRAWALMFNDFLATQGRVADYGDEDYFAYVDGKPRYEGVASFLESRDIDLPYGEMTDSVEMQSVCGLGNNKNAAFAKVLSDEGVTAYAGSLALLDALRESKMPMAIVSSSRNAPDVLAAAGVTDYFATVMHGGVADERGLPGKPAPDTFLAAARDLGVDPARAVVLEDALSGVRAGAAGDFALVIGVNRGVGADALRQAGAGLVVEDLAELL